MALYLGAAALLCLPAIAAAQGQASNAATTPEGFATKAAHTNMAEVQLGHLAQQKASNADVKEFAERMVTDHTDAQAKLKDAAGKANVTLPEGLDQKHKDLKDQLQQKSGAAFDTMYINKMVQGHEQAGERRALVVSYEPFHRSGLVTVCPITAARSEARYPGDVPIPRGEAGQTRDAVIVVSQVRTISLRRVRGASLGTISDRRLRGRVRQALAHQLGFDIPAIGDGAH